MVAGSDHPFALAEPPGWQIACAPHACHHRGSVPGGSRGLDSRRAAVRATAALRFASEMTVRVLVVDDHPAFRRALISALTLVEGVEVAGEAGGGLAACDEAAARIDSSFGRT